MTEQTTASSRSAAGGGLGDLTGRVAFVTGGGSGLGRALSRELSGRGAHVLVVDRDLEAATKVVGECAGSAEPVHLDVTDSAAVNTEIDRAFETHGDAFDCLINNAGTDRGAD